MEKSSRICRKFVAGALHTKRLRPSRENCSLHKQTGVGQTSIPARLCSGHVIIGVPDAVAHLDLAPVSGALLSGASTRQPL
jgi:hypothetical protein